MKIKGKIMDEAGIGNTFRRLAHRQKIFHWFSPASAASGSAAVSTNRPIVRNFA